MAAWLSGRRRRYSSATLAAAGAAGGAGAGGRGRRPGSRWRSIRSRCSRTARSGRTSCCTRARRCRRQTGPLLDDVAGARGAVAALRPGRTYHVFLCDTPAVVRGVRAVEPRRGRGDAGVPGRQRLPPAVEHRTQPADRAVGRRQAGRAHAGVLHRARGDARDDRRSHRALALPPAWRRSSRRDTRTTSRSRGRSTSRAAAQLLERDAPEMNPRRSGFIAARDDGRLPAAAARDDRRRTAGAADRSGAGAGCAPRGSEPLAAARSGERLARGAILRARCCVGCRTLAVGLSACAATATSPGRPFRRRARRYLLRPSPGRAGPIRLPLMPAASRSIRFRSGGGPNTRGVWRPRGFPARRAAGGGRGGPRRCHDRGSEEGRSTSGSFRPPSTRPAGARGESERTSFRWATTTDAGADPTGAPVPRASIRTRSSHGDDHRPRGDVHAKHYRDEPRTASRSILDRRRREALRPGQDSMPSRNSIRRSATTSTWSWWGAAATPSRSSRSPPGHSTSNTSRTEARRDSILRISAPAC